MSMSAASILRPLAASVLMLSACQTAPNVQETPPPRYAGAVAWYPDAVSMSYRPAKPVRHSSEMTMDAVSGAERLRQKILVDGEVGCSAYGADLLCRVSVLRTSGTENGEPQSFGVKGGYAAETIMDRHGRSRALRVVGDPSISGADLDKMNEAAQSLRDRLFLEYPAAGLRVGDKITIADNKTVNGAGGAPFTYSAEGVVLGKSRDGGRDVIVFDLRGTMRQGRIGSAFKGYFLADTASGLVVEYKSQAHIRDGASTALMRISSSAD